MSIRIRRFEEGDIPSIDRLNARLERGGVTDRVYPESPTTFSESRGDALSQELYVAVDDDEVRGGVWLHEHRFFLRGEATRAGWLKYPVAESLIDRAYGGVPGGMLVTLMRRQPEIMALGMGGRAAPIAQLLASLGCTVVEVPFYVAPVRAGRLLMHLPQRRTTRVWQTAARVVGRSGLATAVSAPLSLLRATRTRLLLRHVTAAVTPEFGAWADDVWSKAHAEYGFIARRDAAMLNQFYGPDFPRLARLRITRSGEDIGWICTTIAEPGSEASSREFGELRVGMLADAFGAQRNAATILSAGVRHLVSLGADLIVTNQMHRAWRAPLRYLGFLPWSSNFLFAYSKRIAARVAPAIASGDLFLNRGDCDGPPRWT